MVTIGENCNIENDHLVIWSRPDGDGWTIVAIEVRG
jgi:hypothetical protein